MVTIHTVMGRAAHTEKFFRAGFLFSSAFQVYARIGTCDSAARRSHVNKGVHRRGSYNRTFASFSNGPRRNVLRASPLVLTLGPLGLPSCYSDTSSRFYRLRLSITLLSFSGKTSLAWCYKRIVSRFLQAADRAASS